MKLSVIKSNDKEITLFVEPDILVEDLLIMLYHNSPELHPYYRLEAYQNTALLYSAGKKLALNKSIQSCAIDETSDIRVAMRCPEIPLGLCCPLTLQIYRNPVFLPTSGKTVERRKIEQSLERNPYDPFNRKELHLIDLQSNRIMLRKVEKFFNLYEKTPFFDQLKAQQYNSKEPSSQLLIQHTNLFTHKKLLDKDTCGKRLPNWKPILLPKLTENKTTSFDLSTGCSV